MPVKLVPGVVFFAATFTLAADQQPCPDSPSKSQALLTAVNAAVGEGRGVIWGRVLIDDAPLPGATVTLHSGSRGRIAEQFTNVDGEYAFLNAVPGKSYRVQVELVGLKTSRHRNVRVDSTNTTFLTTNMRFENISAQTWIVCDPFDKPQPLDGPGMRIPQTWIENLP